MNSTPMATMALAALTLPVAVSVEDLAPRFISGATGGLINDSRVPASSPANLFGGRKSKAPELNVRDRFRPQLVEYLNQLGIDPARF